MAARTDTTLDQLTHIIDGTFADVIQFESYNCRISFRSLYRALGNQLRGWYINMNSIVLGI